MKRIKIGILPKLEFASNESFNTLATNLSYCGSDIKTILMTSRYAYEGKSFVTMNLMRTLASLQKKVVFVDTDLRCSKLVGNYNMRFPDGDYQGLAHYLAGMCDLQDIVYETNIKNAYMVPIGREVNSSLQLLSSSRMPTLMRSLADAFDVVLVDTPPVGVIVDALEVAKYCDGAVLVVSYNRGRKQDIQTVTESITKTGCPILGAVLNNVDFGSLVSKKYYYKSERYASYYNENYNPYLSSKKRKSPIIKEKTNKTDGE